MDIFNVTFVLAAYIIWCVLSQLGYHYINKVYNISKHASSTIVLKDIPCNLSSTNVNMVKNVSYLIDRNNVFIFRTKTDIFKQLKKMVKKPLQMAMDTHIQKLASADIDTVI